MWCSRGLVRIRGRELLGGVLLGSEVDIGVGVVDVVK